MADIGKILDTLAAAYPAHKPADQELLVALWERKLGDFKEAVLDLAVDLVITKSRYFPSLNEFLQACKVSQVDYDSAMGDLSRRIAATKALRDRQNRLELEATDFEFDAEAWEALARAWTSAGRYFAAQACREKAELIRAAIETKSVAMETEIGHGTKICGG